MQLVVVSLTYYTSRSGLVSVFILTLTAGDGTARPVGTIMQLYLTGVYPHDPPFFTGLMPFLPPNQQCQSTEGGWWMWALVSPDGVAPSWMVSVSVSVNLPLHNKVQHRLTRLVPEEGP